MREVALEHDADALGRKRLFEVLVHVVGVVVRLEADVAALRQLVFQVELADEGVLLVRVILVAEISVEYKPVVEELAGEEHLDLRIRDAVLARADVRAYLHLVRDAVQQAGELRREGRRGDGGEVVRADRAGIFGRIEFVQNQEIDDLAGHHVLRIDEALDLPLEFLVRAGQLEVERDLRTAERAVEVEDAVDGDVRARAFHDEALVQVADVGGEVVNRVDVHVGLQRVAVERDETPLANLKLLVNKLLEAEVVAPALDADVAVHAQVRAVAVLNLEAAAAGALDTVARRRIHNQLDFGLGRDVEEEIHADFSPLFGGERRDGERVGRGALFPRVFLLFLFVHEGDEVIFSRFGAAHEVEENLRLRFVAHIDVDVQDLGVSLDLRRAAAEDRAVDERVVPFGGVVHQHIVGADVNLVVELLEMAVVDGQIHRAGVLILVVHREVAYLDGLRLQRDGVGERVIRIEEIDAHAAVLDKRVPLDRQLLERPVEVDTPEALAPDTARNLFHKRLEEGNINVIGIEMEREAGGTFRAFYGVNVAVHVCPGRIVLVDASFHQDTHLLVVPRAEEFEQTQLDLVEGEVADEQIGVEDAPAVEVVDVELACRFSGELEGRDVQDVEDIAQFDVVQLQVQRIFQCRGDKTVQLGILAAVVEVEVADFHLFVLHADSSRREIPYAVVQNHLRRVEADVRAQGFPLLLVLVLGKEGGGG